MVKGGEERRERKRRKGGKKIDGACVESAVCLKRGERERGMR